jgi:hypothetical protein
MVLFSLLVEVLLPYQNLKGITKLRFTFIQFSKTCRFNPSMRRCQRFSPCTFNQCQIVADSKEPFLIRYNIHIAGIMPKPAGGDKKKFIQ